MARKKPTAHLSRDERPEFLARVAALAGVPAEHFPALAKDAAEKYHDAVLAGHIEALDQAEDAYCALVYKLNGDTLFGCKADDDSAGHVLARAVAAQPGQVPSWGQAGEFLLEVEGLRVWVVLPHHMLGNHRFCDLCAVDLDKPFISETGYRSVNLSATSSIGESVDQTVRRVVLELMQAEGKLKAIEGEYVERRGKDKRPKWLAEALAGIKSNGQLAMFGDAPKDPNAKAPMSNADRQRAFRERQRKLKDEQGMQAVLLDEEERQLIYRLRELKRKADPIDDPRPFLLTQRDRTYLTGALDYYEFCTYGKWSQEYPKQNLRELYVRLSVHRQYAQETDFPPVEKRMAWEHEQITKSVWDGLKKQIAALEQEKNLLESERNKAHKAIGTWENRLRAAGQSTDYRPLPGEQGHVTVTNDKD